MNNLSPVRIVKNPDGSLAQAAMMQVHTTQKTGYYTKKKILH